MTERDRGSGEPVAAGRGVDAATHSGWSAPERAISTLIWGIFLAARTLVFAVAAPMEFSDTASFLLKASAPLLDADFFLGPGRLFVVPVFYKATIALAGTDPTWLTTTQFVISLAAWTILALAFAASLEWPWLRVAAFAATLVLGLTADVTQWDRALLSDSISLSLFSALVGAWIYFGGRPTVLAAGGLLTAAVSWSFTREANGYLLLAFAAVIVVWGISYRRRDRRVLGLCAVIAITYVTLFFLPQFVAERGERWFFPLLNVVGRWVLPSAERTAYFAARGMPVSPRLMRMSGEFASGDNWAFYDAPELTKFRAWLRSDGRTVYAGDLLTHPMRTIREPLVDIETFACPDLTIYRPPGFADVLGRIGIGWSRLCSRAWAILLAWLSLGVGMTSILAAIILRNRISSTAGFKMLMVGVLVASWCPLTWFTWHAVGEMEVSRHVLWATMAFRIGILLSLGYLLDGGLAWVAPSARRRAASSSALCASPDEGTTGAAGPPVRSGDGSEQARPPMRG